MRRSRRVSPEPGARARGAALGLWRGAASGAADAARDGAADLEGGAALGGGAEGGGALAHGSRSATGMEAEGRVSGDTLSSSRKMKRLR